MGDKIQKRLPDALKENTQYALAFGLIATMLFVAGFPMFVIFFFGIFAYFLWKTFSQPSRSETREIFEFYLAANEILRDDERRWFGFEVQEVVARGERVLQSMNGSPPLVYFTLGALYNKIGDHKSAVNHLAYVIENENADESTYVYPSADLRNYVKWLRKIEREPADAPQTSASVRALERARRNRGKTLLEDSRKKLEEENRTKSAALSEQGVQAFGASDGREHVDAGHSSDDRGRNGRPLFGANARDERKKTGHEKPGGKQVKKRSEEDPYTDRKSISEVLHDIYDKNVQ